MRVAVLGPLELSDETGRRIEITGRRLRALLIRLAIDAGRYVTADRLIHDLWENAPPSAPTAALQSLISRLRAAGVRDLVESGPGGYRLAVAPDQVDVSAFEQAVAAALTQQEPQLRTTALRQALLLWRGPALSEVADAGFATGPIARLDGLRLRAVEERIEADLALGEADRVIGELQALRAEHPTRERLAGQLMRALYAGGRQAAALEVYTATRHELAERLGVDPSTELTAVQLAILRHDPALVLDSSRPPEPDPTPRRPAPAHGRRTNLPTPLTSFVGREQESEQLEQMLRQSRLVTLTGPGGAGKTRLAREITARLVDDFSDGVWFVPLAPVSSPLDVPQAVMVALGVPDAVRAGDVRAVIPPLERLADVLADRRLILVLDNCEHLIDAIAELADRVLGEGPGLRILATSREPLGITGETLCPVPSLPLPRADADPREAGKFASVQLFADRAAAVRPGFVVDDESAAQVIGICRELDGIPLAIELAAARMRSLSLGQIADRLDDRFRLLSGGNRAALPRHQTLRAVVDWSWDLLDEAERIVLRRLSVFTGGATPDNAEQVCGGGEGRDVVHPLEVIDVIASLVDKSLVITTGDGEVRYRLLETVRVYAAEKLAEAGEPEAIRAAHAHCFVELAERAEPELRRADQLRWLHRLTAERDNCTAALQFTIESRDVRTALRLIAALAWFWVMSDYEAEAGTWAIAVRDLAGDVAPPGLDDAYAICVITAVMVVEMSAAGPGPTHRSVAQAMDRAVRLVPESTSHPVLSMARPLAAVLVGDLVLAHRHLLILAGHADPWVRAITTVCLSYLAYNEGRVEESAAHLTAGYAGFAALGDRWGKVLTLRALTELARIQGDPDASVRYAEEAYGYACEGVSPEEGAAVLINLGAARMLAGPLDQADRGRDEVLEGIRRAERIGEQAEAANGYLILSESARRAGDLAAARPLVEAALRLVEPKALQAGFTDSSARTFSLLGCLCEQEGDLTAAGEWHSRAVQVVQNDVITHHQSLAGVIEGLAALSAARGDHERAAELLGTGRALHGYPDRYSVEVGRVSAAAAEALGQDLFDASYQRGRAIPRDQVLALALRETDPTAV